MSNLGNRQPPKIRTDTISGIRDGYGAEDIAVMGGHDPEGVRFEIRRLREAGLLLGIIAEGRAA
jgi:hypothetical protein